ncbi:XAC0095 family protein [Noviluteimonas gilva]|uniref:XAC0095-like domain-containing protein n=1 Tax=Noviluteimonas gilva TaxID=2682097 RepID=A0A7C9HNC6_9GAMM|nr:hypothetical protein [Lysobacter gilvus]MUV15195.1 hypothetical protein [Lysobacter gilvus]
MSNVLKDPRTSTAVFGIPEPAHFSLVQIAYFMRLMAQLTKPGSNASDYEAILRPNSLGWCFSSLSKELDAILGAISDRAVTAAQPARRRKLN